MTFQLFLNRHVSEKILDSRKIKFNDSMRKGSLLKMSAYKVKVAEWVESPCGPR